MISKEFKEILDSVGGRYIIVDEGRPRYIVMSFEEYKRVFLGEKPVQLLTERELVAKINSDIALWREGKVGIDVDDALSEEIEKIEGLRYV